MATVAWLVICSGGFLNVKITNEECIACHEGVEKIAPVHEKVSCQDCHHDIQEIPHSVPTQRIDCLRCHQELMNLWVGDPHLAAREKGNKNAPDCQTCHGKHDLKTWGRKKAETSEIQRQRVQIFCNTCHMAALVEV